MVQVAIGGPGHGHCQITATATNDDFFARQYRFGVRHGSPAFGHDRSAGTSRALPSMIEESRVVDYLIR
jgi:hypothetical protein